MQLDPDGLPRIVPVFKSLREGYTNELYVEAIKRVFRDLIPFNYFADVAHDEELLDDQVEKLKRQLPIVRRTPFGPPPCDLSFFLLAEHRPNAFKFFFEIISRWLIPGRRLNAQAFFAIDFQMPDISDATFTLVEISVRVDSHEDMLQIQKNWPATETELCLGVQSAYHAHRILEIKGLSADEKTALIQEHIAYIMRRRPQDFDPDVISEMQHMLVTCRDEFKAQRGYRHLSRIIAVQYLFRKALRETVKEAPNRRHLSLKVIKTRVTVGDEKKTVLGILVAVNFIRDHEILEEQHLLNAIRNYISSVNAVKGSFLTHTSHSDTICTLYIEIEKADDKEFCSEEIARLRRELPGDLKDRIQHLMHPIFLPQNEEEVMRNMLTLASQIRFLRDIPQVIISFDEQTTDEVSFVVIFVRLLKMEDPAVATMFRHADVPVSFSLDRSKIVGYLRKKYPKEASVFRVRLPKRDYLRRDHSVDLQKARQVVVEQVRLVMGEFRDYNGGMISKQNELFCAVHNLLADVGKANEFLLENFFYSLTPVVARSLLDPQTLKTLFLMLLEALEESFFQSKDQFFNVREEEECLYIMLRLDDPSVKERIGEELEALNLSSMELARTFVTVYDNPYLGYILTSEDPLRRQQFVEAVTHAFQGSPEPALA